MLNTLEFIHQVNNNTNYNTANYNNNYIEINSNR